MMQDSTQDIRSVVAPISEQDKLMQRLAAILCQPGTTTTPSVPLVADVGNILLQLTQAVAQAKSEAEHERSLRIALEHENEAIRFKQFGISESTSTIGDEASGYSYQAPYGVLARSSESLIDSALSLADCLTLMSSLQNPELVHICYNSAGFLELDLTRIERIYKPYDFGQVMFVVFNSYDAFVPHDLVPFSYANIESLISGSFAATTLASTPSIKVDSDDEPRMNLLEALNVQSDEDCTRIVTVRKCHKLGFKSHIHLRQYFARFGKVERVVLLPMRAKPKGSLDGRGNRPSSMGFVVMESPDSVEKILAFDNGSGVHEIKGWPIEVRNFVKPADKSEREISGGTVSGFGLLSATSPFVAVPDELSITNVW